MTGQEIATDRSADVVVVGAGVAGLCAARELRRRGWSVLVLERETTPGGRVRTEQWRGARIELGAEFVTRSYSRTIALVDELGLRDELVPEENALTTAIRRDGTWHYVDYARVLSVLRCSAIGWRGKLSLCVGGFPALALGWLLAFGDIASAARLDTRPLAHTLHSDVFGFYVSPIYEAFFAYRPSELSYPLLALPVRVRTGYLTLAQGMGSLTLALSREGEIELGVEVEQVRRDGTGVTVSGRDREGRTRAYRARAAILATPAHDAAQAWSEAPGEVRRFLKGVSYSRTDLVYLRTAEPYWPTTADGKRLYMELIPPPERAGTVLAFLGFENRRAPSGGLLLAQPAPGSGVEGLDGEALADRLQAETEALHPELRGEIVDRRIVRTAVKVPRFAAGESRRLAAFRRTLRPSPIDLAGDYLQAPWIEGAVLAGEAAASRVDSFLAMRG